MKSETSVKTDHKSNRTQMTAGFIHMESQWFPVSLPEATCPALAWFLLTHAHTLAQERLLIS